LIIIYFGTGILVMKITTAGCDIWITGATASATGTARLQLFLL
jgi:hypothetical protein